MCDGRDKLIRFCPGIPDEEFIRGKVPMTKQEVRIQIMGLARIQPNDLVIDIGAGTGSLSIEAGLLAANGTVYAVERNSEAVSLIQANAVKFNTENLQVIQGTAPDALEGLPKANVIFVGGSGGRFLDIMSEADRLLAPLGRFIVTAVTVDTVYHALSWFKKQDVYQVRAHSLQVTRIEAVSQVHMFKALNPIYLIAGTKMQGCQQEVNYGSE